MARTANDSAERRSDPPERIRVLIADDQLPLRQAISDLVENATEMTMVGAAPDAAEAIELAVQTAPDVALLDVKMPGGGAHAAAEILAVSPETKVLALSAYSDRASVLNMLRSGAIGYLVKGTPPREILEAIRRAAQSVESVSGCHCGCDRGAVPGHR